MTYFFGFILWAVVGLLCGQVARLPGKGWLTAGFFLLSARSLLHFLSGGLSSHDDPAELFGPWLLVGAAACFLAGVVLGANPAAGSASFGGLGDWLAGLPWYGKAALGSVVAAPLLVLLWVGVALQHDLAVRDKNLSHYIEEGYHPLTTESNVEDRFPSVPSERDGPAKSEKPLDPAVDGSPAERIDRASALEVKAEDLRSNGDKSQAKDAFRQAIHIYDKLVEEFPNNPDYQFVSAVDCRRWGDLETDLGNNDAATTAYSEAQNYLEKLVADHADNATYVKALLDLYDIEGKFFANTDRKGDSVDAFTKAEKLRGMTPKDPNDKDKP